jgi:hypothetical protein
MHAVISPRGGHQPGHAAVVRRLASRLGGQAAAVTDALLRPGEVIVFGEASPCFRAMSAGRPVLFDQLDDETAERLGRRPGGLQVASRYTSFLAIPLMARGTVVGCATFGRRAASPAFGPGDVTLAPS